MLIETLQSWKMNWRKSNLRMLVLSSFYMFFLIIGASVFSAIEGPPERELVKELRDTRSQFLKSIRDCVTENRGGFYLIHAGYKFSVKSRRGERCYWRCVERQCRARITTIDNVPVGFNQHHQHPSDNIGITADAFLAGVKKRCREEVDPIPTLYDECLGALRDEECDEAVVNVIKRIPTYDSVNEAKIIQISAGGKPPQKRRKYRHLDSRLQQLKDRSIDGKMDVTEYADAASHLIHLE